MFIFFSFVPKGKKIKTYVFIFPHLGKIFYSKIEDAGEVARKASVFGVGRFVGYMSENCIYFVGFSDDSRLFELFSLSDLNIDGFFECAIWVLIAAEKKTSGFFSF